MAPNAKLPAELDREHLTQVLRDGGFLSDQSIREIAVPIDKDTEVSHVRTIELLYDRPAPMAPNKLFVKTGQPGRITPTRNASKIEGSFYSGLAATLPGGITPRCYGAFQAGDSEAWHILLEDLDPTHERATQWTLPPPLPRFKDIVATLARIHAVYWDDPRLGVTVGNWPTHTWSDTPFDKIFPGFVAMLGERLSAERRDLLEAQRRSSKVLFARYAGPRNATLIHGDAHVLNFMVSRDPVSKDTRLLDWESWRLGTATDDLAYLIAMQYPPDYRRRFERLLLDHYWENLDPKGNYSRDALQEDYRRSVLLLLRRPLFQWDARLSASIWWNNLERIMLAANDLSCRDLLG
ncbi:MAG: phosphotransferase [Proteobacteria bacterium]|nr:phosphotransferase [Pseudomonadota bacterium]